MGKKARLKKARKLPSDQDRPAQTLQDRKKPGLLKKTFIFILFFLTLGLGIGLRLYNLTNIPSRSPDERVHTYQARTIFDEGPIKGVRKLVSEYNADPQQWVYPKPIRVGYLWPIALLMKITNRTDVALGSYISCFFSALALVILIILGLRFFNKWITLHALLFMSVSCVPLAISRRTWSDAMLECLGLLCVYLSCEIIRSTGSASGTLSVRDAKRPGRGMGWYVLFTITGSYSALVKESGAVFYALCLVWILWVLLVKERSVKEALSLIALSIFGGILSASVILYATGGLRNILETMRHFSEALPGNTYAAEYQTGPWYRFLGGFWIISPLNTVLCLFGMVFGKKKPEIVFGVMFFMLALVAATIAAPFSQNMRYISPLFGIFYLLAGFGLWNIISYAKTRLSNFYFSVAVTCAVILLITGAMGDYRNFKKIFIRTGIVDTSIKLLRDHSR